MLRDFGFASMLWDVIPRVRFDYVSYSSHESLSNGGSALSSDLDLIRSVARTDRIIIGEIGFQRSSSGDRLIPWTIFAINAALDSGVVYIVQWNLYDQVSSSDFGLYDVDGKMTDIGSFYKQAFGSNAESARKLVGFGIK